MLITVKENTKMQRESIQECSQMASLWGCADKEAKLQQLALGKSQVVIAPAQVITRKVRCESHCLMWAESCHKQFLLGIQELPPPPPNKGVVLGRKGRAGHCFLAPCLLLRTPSGWSSCLLLTYNLSFHSSSCSEIG